MHELPASCRGAQQLWAPPRCDGGAPSLGPGSARPAVNLWLLTAALPLGLRGVGSLILTLLQRGCGSAQPGGCGGARDEHPIVPPDGSRPPPGAVLELPRRCHRALRTPVPCGHPTSAAPWLRPSIWAPSLHPGWQRCSVAAIPARPVPKCHLGGAAQLPWLLQLQCWCWGPQLAASPQLHSPSPPKSPEQLIGGCGALPDLLSR